MSNFPLPSIAFLSPAREKCGVSDYGEYLFAELAKQVNVKVHAPGWPFPLEANNADLIHIQHQYFLFGGVAPWKNTFYKVLWSARRPVILTAHEFVEPAGSLPRKMSIRLTNHLNFIHPSVHRILVHTREDMERMGRSGIPKDRITVVRHGVPPAPELPGKDFSKKVLDAQDRFIITLFGFLSLRKGHSLAIEAMRSLPDDCLLLLAGGKHPDDHTTYSEELQGLIHHFGLQNRVRITGYLSSNEVKQVMSATDLVIAPFSESSGSGSMAFAFACAKPVLASNIPPHREILAETPYSLCMMNSIEPKDVAGIIETLRTDKALLDGLSRGARRYATDHTYARMAAETVAIYRTVLSE